MCAVGGAGGLGVDMGEWDALGGFLGFWKKTKKGRKRLKKELLRNWKEHFSKPNRYLYNRAGSYKIEQNTSSP